MIREIEKILSKEHDNLFKARDELYKLCSRRTYELLEPLIEAFYKYTDKLDVVALKKEIVEVINSEYGEKK